MNPHTKMNSICFSLKITHLLYNIHLIITLFIIVKSYANGFDKS